MTKNNYFLSAEVILKSKTGHSLLNEDVNVTTKNIEDYYPSRETINHAIRELQDLGFKVYSSDLSLTIVGKIEQFEEIFNTTIVKHNTSKEIEMKFQRAPTIPNSINNIVETIVFSPSLDYLS